MRLTKKLINEYVELVKQHGYWSNEVLEFHSKIPYSDLTRLEMKAVEVLGRRLR